jgi:acetyl-CoA acetyltransferase
MLKSTTMKRFMSTHLNEVVIVSAARTPVGCVVLIFRSFNKSLKSLTAPQLGAIAIRAGTLCLQSDRESWFAAQRH